MVKVLLDRKPGKFCLTGTAYCKTGIRKDLATFDFRAVSGHVHGNHRFHQTKQTDCQVAPHLALAEMNTASFIYRSINWVLFNEAPPRLCARKHSVYTTVLRTLSGWPFANCSFNFHFKWKWKLWRNGEFVLQADFRLRLPYLNWRVKRPLC